MDTKTMNKNKTLVDLFKAKETKTKIRAISCYDYNTAKLISQTDIDLIIVGDSASQIILGYDSTLPVTMDFMVAITAAVRRGAPEVFLVADMPFLSYQVDKKEAIRNAGRFLTEANVQMVKIEATAAQLDTIKAVSDAGIAVMAHIGIRPQRVSKIGKFKAEATTAEQAIELITLSDQMINAGAGILLIEGTTAEVGDIITKRFTVPVISCGSGVHCDGQVLILPDILGLTIDQKPKFSKSYADLGKLTIEAVNEYCKEVTQSAFPDSDHCYHMKPGELDRLTQLLKSQ
jgi:3-methyl-2-oxobutanoate hydroxymethyltransferase